ncbi:hypothetical protein GON03_03110 [Nocardioides sp. MAH-18]|uniref:DUF1349 domain-containing protein n=1 Tax=Nocardioides agri TaxID=2682843 RepID=A0A6L6XNI3_9ACTN|nr:MULTISPECIES: hypothetical protein [unclassified Nocardioides]MBA2953288.1 hypothetical protein [Nocardioides sp. CGMCC 1.13656]MVQ48156.1 hypothetical protein [Nocardioides sp. MAH-18]
MTTRSTLRTALAFTAAVAALYAGTAALPSAEADSQTAPRTTTLTFEVPDCEGCELSLVQSRWDDDARYGVRTWNGPDATVEDGTATVTVRTSRTWGLSVLVSTPWDGQLAAETTVAWRYAGHDVGDEVTFADARDERKASACWEGTRRGDVTIPLTVRQVRVEGVHGPVAGTIAFATETQSWLQPMRRTFRGVLASQDVNVCGPRA